jgi:hypothetical protein
MGILFWSFLLILYEFWHVISFIVNVISLTFYAYIERRKRSSDAILASVLVGIWPSHSNHRHDDVMMHVVTVDILFWWFPLILDEFWHDTSCVERLSPYLSIYAYVEHRKRSPDAILAFVLVWMWSYHSSHGHRLHQQCPWLLWANYFYDPIDFGWILTSNKLH